MLDALTYYSEFSDDYTYDEYNRHLSIGDFVNDAIYIINRTD